jgi:hypothetical protein
MVYRPRGRARHGREYYVRSGTWAWRYVYCRWHGLLLLAQISDAQLWLPGSMADADRRRLEMPVKRVQKASKKTGPGDVKLGTWGRTIPDVLRWLVDDVYDDGEPRQPGTLTLSFRGGMWSWSVTDPDSAQVLRLVDTDPLNGLNAMQAHLISESCVWEAAPWLERSKKKGKGR